MHNLVVLHMPHDSVVGIYTPTSNGLYQLYEHAIPHLGSKGLVRELDTQAFCKCTVSLFIWGNVSYSLSHFVSLCQCISILSLLLSGYMFIAVLLSLSLCLSASQCIPIVLFRSFPLQVSPCLWLHVPRSPALCLTPSTHLHLTLPLVLSASLSFSLATCSSLSLSLSLLSLSLSLCSSLPLYP